MSIFLLHSISKQNKKARNIVSNLFIISHCLFFFSLCAHTHIHSLLYDLHSFLKPLVAPWFFFVVRYDYGVYFNQIFDVFEGFFLFPKYMQDYYLFSFWNSSD
jgi:hypothetical protein